QPQRRPEAPRGPQVGGGRESLRSGLPRHARRREDKGCPVPAGQPLLPPALQLERGGKPPAGMPGLRRMARLLVQVRELAPNSGRLAEPTGKLTAAGEPLQGPEAAVGVLALRPQLESTA